MALPKWLPFVRRPPPAPPAEARTVHIYWFTAACFLLLLLRLWLWHTAGQRAKRKALLEAERAISARRSAARHHDGDLPPRSSDIYERVQDCLRLWREAKYLEGYEELQWLRKHLPIVDESIRWPSREQLAARRLKHLTDAGGEMFLLEKRGRICEEALDTLIGSSEGWDVTVSDEGTKVSSRVRPMPGPNNMIDTKVEAVLDGIQCEHTLMVFREGDLYPSWFPFVSHGSIVYGASATEVIAHLLFEVNLYGCMDLCLQGFGCDNLRDGNFLLCVRHCSQQDVLPLTGREIELPPKPNATGKLFKLGRIKAIIDIMVEPLSPTSVRFSYSCSQPAPKIAPAWIISWVLKSGMGSIFGRMKAVCRAMASGDPASRKRYPIVDRLSTPEYKYVVDDLSGRVEGYLRRMGWA